MGRGFSSSAALCVVTARILAQNAGLDRTPEDIADLAYRAEREGVGVACGRLDPLACAYAQPLLLRWPESIRPIPVERTVPLVAAAFPTPRNAPGILRALHALHRPHGANEAERAVCETIAIWGQLAEAGADLLRRGQATELGRLLDQAQQLYEERLIPHVPALHAPGLVDACRRLKQAGALGAKFSGAGGDGSVIAIAQDPPHAERLATTLRAQGLLAWSL
jgi:mevalonate kinase